MAALEAAPGPGWTGAQLRGAPPALLAAVTSIVILALAACVTGLLENPGTSTAWWRFGELALLSVLFEEMAAQVGKMRLLISTSTRSDMTSVWTFAAALLLPIGAAELLVGVVAAHIWLRHQRASGWLLYRKVYSTAAIGIAVAAAGSIVHRWTSHTQTLPHGMRTATVVIVALIVYTLVNRVLIVLAAYLASGSAPSIVGTWAANALELATLCLGAMMAVVLLTEPWLGVLVLLPMVLLQRGALVKELEQAAVTDAKTGLLNADAWRRAAVRELARAEREHTSTGVLIIDLDHFKEVNDEYGHLVGDLALLAVGRRLTLELRQYDLVGRFGGEEFVALLPRIDRDAAAATAERIRAAIAGISLEDLNGHDHAASTATLSASVGLATYPEHGTGADELLVAADTALYRAKRGGRNRVVVADAVPATESSVPSVPSEQQPSPQRQVP